MKINIWLIAITCQPSVLFVGKRCYLPRVPGAVRAGAEQADAGREVLQEQGLRAVLPRGLDLLPGVVRQRRQRRRLTTAPIPKNLPTIVPYST